MPIYEYRCRENGHEFEILQKISDPMPATCEHCDSPVEKKVSLSSFHLKGSGWYATDYKKPEKPKGDGAEATKDKASSETSTETAKEASSSTETNEGGSK